MTQTNLLQASRTGMGLSRLRQFDGASARRLELIVRRAALVLSLRSLRLGGVQVHRGGAETVEWFRSSSAAGSVPAPLQVREFTGRSQCEFRSRRPDTV